MSTPNVIETEVLTKLDAALAVAETAWSGEAAPQVHLSARFQAALETLSVNAQAASAAFTNVITCLAIKAARPVVDVRYHQVQIQSDTTRGAGFNFRGVSEDAVYPWLSRHRFDGAKSGWQTRTLERPKPYTMTYDENIGRIKNEFLTVFDEVETKEQSAMDALIYLTYKQVIKREQSKITLSVPKIQDIAAIVELFRSHFFYDYKASKGASRLPVLALHATYSVLVTELRRYKGKTLRTLQEHSAADSQTGSLGDIEVVEDENGAVFEAVEVKHGLQITEAIAADVQQKVMDKAVERYYILTTHDKCDADEGAKAVIGNIKAVYNCQVIANGVMPSLRYYLRLLDVPSSVFPAYVELLRNDKAIAHEHRTAWNAVVKNLSL